MQKTRKDWRRHIKGERVRWRWGRPSQCLSTLDKFWGKQIKNFIIVWGMNFFFCHSLSEESDNFSIERRKFSSAKWKLHAGTSQCSDVISNWLRICVEIRLNNFEMKNFFLKRSLSYTDSTRWKTFSTFVHRPLLHCSELCKCNKSNFNSNFKSLFMGKYKFNSSHRFFHHRSFLSSDQLKNVLTVHESKLSVRRIYRSIHYSTRWLTEFSHFPPSLLGS